MRMASLRRTRRDRQRNSAVTAAEQTSVSQFKGLNFGIGIGMSADAFDRKRPRVQRIESIDDTVRVLEQKSSLPRVFLDRITSSSVKPGASMSRGGMAHSSQSSREAKTYLMGWRGGWMLGYRRGRVTRPEDAGDNQHLSRKGRDQSFQHGSRSAP